MASTKVPVIRKLSFPNSSPVAYMNKTVEQLLMEEFEALGVACSSDQAKRIANKMKTYYRNGYRGNAHAANTSGGT